MAPSPRELQSILLGEPGAFAGLLQRWSGYIERLARRFAKSAFDRDDFVQTGICTLYDVCLSTRTKLLVKFESYARRAIWFAMNELIRRGVNRLDQSVVFMPADDLEEQQAAGLEPVDSLFLQHRAEAIREWLTWLPERERTIVQLRYWEGESQASTARRLGLTRARVNQIERELLVRARRCFAIWLN